MPAPPSQGALPAVFEVAGGVLSGTTMVFKLFQWHRWLRSLLWALHVGAALQTPLLFVDSSGACVWRRSSEPRLRPVIR